MKLRDSGMPEEGYWETLVRAVDALDRLSIEAVTGDAAEFGCGYGTFTLPLAARVTGVLWTYDIDAPMIERTGERLRAGGVTNTRPVLRDLFEDGTGLDAGSTSLVTIFNLLHCEQPEILLREARRILGPGGCLAVMHWRWDDSTPRGPSLAIRPQPAQLRALSEAAGFRATTKEAIDLPPYHYGWSLRLSG